MTETKEIDIDEIAKEHDIKSLDDVPKDIKDLVRELYGDTGMGKAFAQSAIDCLRAGKSHEEIGNFVRQMYLHDCLFEIGVQEDLED